MGRGKDISDDKQPSNHYLSNYQMSQPTSVRRKGDDNKCGVGHVGMSDVRRGMDLQSGFIHTNVGKE